MKKIDTIINTAYLLILFILAIVMLMDTAGVIASPEDYRVPHHFSNRNLSWKSPEVLRYLLLNLFIICVIAFFTWIGIRKMAGKLKANYGSVYIM